MRSVNLTGGAKFVRADLHIHTFGDKGSYDLTDTTMTPSAIVDEAISRNLSFISITDHNEILNSYESGTYAVGKPLLVIPGVEVSTTQGHLLAYFRTFAELRAFHGKLSFTEDKKRCNQSAIDCLNIIETLHGVGILAHIEVDAGFEATIGRYGGPMEDLVSHPALYALEIASKGSAARFTDEDDLAERRRLAKLRQERLSLPDGNFLPKVMFSDSHSLSKFGKNAAGEEKLTRFKVDELTFESFLIALMNHESRVRIETAIPERIPKFVSMTIDGGILDRQDISFSPNLTCIIGGRGTGKSTLLEALRIASGNDSRAEVVDSEVWPDKISLVFEDETGEQTIFFREKQMAAQNQTDPDFGLSRVRIESYGQGETAATIQNSDKDPVHLLNFLDGFLEIEPSKAEDTEVCSAMSETLSEIQRLRSELSTEPEFARVLRDLEERNDV